MSRQGYSDAQEQEAETMASLLTRSLHRASSTRNWLRAYRDHHRLYPLWRALYSAFPEIALDLPSRRTRWKEFSPHDIPYRLYQRVIEIQDGYRALRSHLAPLRPHLEPHLPGTAVPRGCPAGQNAKESAAVAEAIRITWAAITLMTRRLARKGATPSWPRKPAPADG